MIWVELNLKTVFDKKPVFAFNVLEGWNKNFIEFFSGSMIRIYRLLKWYKVFWSSGFCYTNRLGFSWGVAGLKRPKIIGMNSWLSIVLQSKQLDVGATGFDLQLSAPKENDEKFLTPYS